MIIHGQRDLSTVIDRLLEVIPDDQQDLRASLTSIRMSAIYAPPENQSLWWREAAMALNDHVPQAAAAWGQRVEAIWFNKETP